MIEALANGALVLTATNRLARALHLEHAAARRAEGLSSWPAPQIFTWNAWIRRQAAEAALDQPKWPHYLNEHQEIHVWTRVIAASSYASALLSIDAAAERARQAYSFLHEWRIPKGALRSTEDGTAFAAWIKSFEDICDTNGWKSEAALADAVTLSFPAQVVLAGFTHLTPRQRELLPASAQRLNPRDAAGKQRLVSYPTPADELLAAARWAREWVEGNPGHRVAIVAPELARIRKPFEAVLRNELAAGHSPLDVAGMPFHVSLGSALADQPFLYAAFTLLEDIPPANQTASRWARAFAEHLVGAQWPPRERTSGEQQLVDAWGETLSTFATLDAVTGAIDRDEALDLLHRIASRVIFQVEDQGQPVQILSVRESIGQSFDAAWLLGFDARVWPPRLDPQPLIPYALQREACNPERALAEAKRMTEYLLVLAPEITVSCSESDVEEHLEPSPLFGHLNLEACAAPVVEVEAAPLVPIPDIAPPFALPAARGGASLFKHQAECPFRAFAIHRLKAKEEPEETPGLNAMQRGSLLHEALSQVWRELRDSTALASASLDVVAERAVANAFREKPPPVPSAYADVERERLTRLLVHWLELERRRPGFRVVVNEEFREIEVNGLKARIKVDRVDELDDGSLVLIDYKGGRASKSSWKGSRPVEPQVPLYAITQPGVIAAAAFGKVRRGESKFEGEAVSAGLLPSVSGREPLPELILQWRQSLEALAKDFLEGKATPDPREAKLCRDCHLAALCRIHGDADIGDEDDAE